MPEPIKTESPLKAVVYSRVSTDAQDKDGTSLDTQEIACLNYAHTAGWLIIDTIRDTASGFDLDRPGISKVRQIVRNGGADVIISYALDRLSRNQHHSGLLFSEMEDRGVKLEFVSEKFEDNPIGRFILSAKAFVAEIEREKISERTMRGKEARAKAGMIPQATGRGIYGYAYDRTSGKRSIIPEQAKTVQRIFDDFIQYHSCNRVTTELNREGIPAFAGGRWHTLTVRRILKNQTYTGKTIYRKTKVEKVFNPQTGRKSRRVFTRDRKDWIEVPDATPQIISPETYNKAQEVLDSPDRRPIRRNSSYSLTGRIKCSICSTPMIGHSLSKGKYKYYRCRRSYSSQQDRKCKARYVGQQILESTVLKQLGNVLSDPDLILTEINNYSAGLIKDPVALKRVNNELKSLSGKEARLAHLFVDGAISVEILKQEEKILKNKRRHLLEEKELLEPRSNQPLDLEEIAEKLPQATNLIREWIENAEGENITLLLDALDVKIKASKTEVQISGAMPIVTEKDENLVTIARTLALQRAYSRLYPKL